MQKQELPVVPVAKAKVYQPLLAYVKATYPTVKKLAIIDGPNGNFVSITLADATRTTMPIGKKSQGATIAELSVSILDDGTAMCSNSQYRDLDAIEF